MDQDNKFGKNKKEGDKMTIFDRTLVQWIKGRADRARLKDGKSVHWKEEGFIFNALKRKGLVQGVVTYIESDGTHAFVSYDHPYHGSSYLKVYCG
jgi:hypothetical protein